MAWFYWRFCPTSNHRSPQGRSGRAETIGSGQSASCWSRAASSLSNRNWYPWCKIAQQGFSTIDRFSSRIYAANRARCDSPVRNSRSTPQTAYFSPLLCTFLVHPFDIPCKRSSQRIFTCVFLPSFLSFKDLSSSSICFPSFSHYVIYVRHRHFHHCRNQWFQRSLQLPVRRRKRAWSSNSYVFEAFEHRANRFLASSLITFTIAVRTFAVSCPPKPSRYF